MYREKLLIPGKRIPEAVQGYKKEDIWNLDKTGFSGRLCLTMDLSKKEGSAKEAR